jgi:hypothetical protein
MEQHTTMDTNNPLSQAVHFSPFLIPLGQPCSENTNTSCPFYSSKMAGSFNSAKWLAVSTRP